MLSSEPILPPFCRREQHVTTSAQRRCAGEFGDHLAKLSNPRTRVGGAGAETGDAERGQIVYIVSNEQISCNAIVLFRERAQCTGLVLAVL